MSTQETPEDYVFHKTAIPENTGLEGNRPHAKSFEPPALPAETTAVSMQVKASSSQKRLKVNVSKRTGFTEAEVTRHKEALALVEIIVNSSEFKKRVLEKKFILNRGKTSQQIYDHLMTGEESLQPGIDYEMDADVVMYEKRNSVVGYTYPGVTTTWINRFYFKSYKLEDIGRNFIHEWAHKLGYSDEGDSKIRKSVPYGIGGLMEDLIREYNDGARWTDLHPEQARGDA